MGNLKLKRTQAAVINIMKLRIFSWHAVSAAWPCLVVIIIFKKC